MAGKKGLSTAQVARRLRMNEKVVRRLCHLAHLKSLDRCNQKCHYIITEESVDQYEISLMPSPLRSMLSVRDICEAYGVRSDQVYNKVRCDGGRKRELRPYYYRNRMYFCPAEVGTVFVKYLENKKATRKKPKRGFLSKVFGWIGAQVW